MMTTISSEMLRKTSPLRNVVFAEVPGLKVEHNTTLELVKHEKQAGRKLHVMIARKCGPECEHVKPGDLLYVDNAIGIETAKPGDMLALKEDENIAAYLRDYKNIENKP